MRFGTVVFALSIGFPVKTATVVIYSHVIIMSQNSQVIIYASSDNNDHTP